MEHKLGNLHCLSEDFHRDETDPTRNWLKCKETSWNHNISETATKQQRPPCPLQGTIFSLDLHWSRRWQNLDQNWLKLANWLRSHIPAKIFADKNIYLQMLFFKPSEWMVFFKIYCDMPGSPCLSKNKANQVCDSFFLKFLSRWLPVGLVHLWTDQRIPGPVPCCCPGGSLETPPRWHATIFLIKVRHYWKQIYNNGPY